MRRIVKVMAILGLAVSGLVEPLPAAAHVTRLGATLNGHAVVSGGDSDGSGWLIAEYDRATERLCYALVTRWIQLANRAEIRSGAMGSTGAEVMRIDVTGEGNQVCAHAGAAAMDKLIAEPSAFHVLVRNPQFPDGALRGQLERR